MNNRYLGSIIAAAALTLAAPPALRAADHGDAPTLAGDQSCDIADVYAFMDPANNDNVVLILTVRGFIVPGENNNFGIFDEDVRYSFNIENTGDAIADMYIDVNFNQRQNPVITKPNSNPPANPDIPGFRGRPRTVQDAIISFRGKVPPDLAGAKGRTHHPVTQPTIAAVASPRDIKPLLNANGATLDMSFFAGEADDPFFFDIPAFNRFVGSVVNPPKVPDATLLDRGRDTFAGYNVMGIAIRLPKSKLLSTKPGAPSTIGVYATTSRKAERTVRGDKVGAGGYVQVDRLGIPGVNVAFIPYNLKNSYNGASPLDDAKGKFIAPIKDTLVALGTPGPNVALLASLVGLPPGLEPVGRGDTLGTGDMLRLDTGKANAGPGGGTGANGFPTNGRRLRDDIIDIVLDAASGGFVTSDHVDKSDVDTLDQFPFLALPQQPRNPDQDPVKNVDDNTRN